MMKKTKMNMNIIMMKMSLNTMNMYGFRSETRQYSAKRSRNQYVIWIRPTLNCNALANWLDEDMSKCIKDKAEAMTDVAGTMRKSLSGPSRDDLLDELLELIKKRWISRLFAGEAQENKNELIIDTSEKNSRENLLQSAYDQIAEGGKMTQQLYACILREADQF